MQLLNVRFSDFLKATVKVEVLNLSFNFLSDFDDEVLAHHNDLREIDLSHNQLTKLAVVEVSIRERKANLKGFGWVLSRYRRNPESLRFATLKYTSFRPRALTKNH